MMRVQFLPSSPYPLVTQLVECLFEEQEVIRSSRIWGTGTLPYSSMAEQRAVNAGVVGSSPTGAAIHCRVDDLESHLSLKQEFVGSNPTSAANYWEVGKQAKPSYFECEV